MSQIIYHGNGWAAAMAANCEMAQKTISLSALSFQPPRTSTDGDWPRLWRSWVDAAKRGVSVNVWMPAPSGRHPATHANVTAGRTMATEGIIPHFVTGQHLLHAKTCVIDTSEVWIGSGNFTIAAAQFNHEAYIKVTSKAIATELENRWRGLA